MLAFPFGRIHYLVGAPLFNPTAEALERAMHELTRAVDRL